MKRILSRLVALTLVLVIGLMGCSSPSGLTGNYRQDALSLVRTMRSAIEVPESTPEKTNSQKQARQMINDFSSRYRRDASLTKLSSYTTIRTALNSLAGHYSSYPNRPVPKKLKDRLEKELNQVEMALKRES